MNAKDILRFVKDLKKELQTNDPYEIAEYYGIKVFHNAPPMKEFFAHTIQIPGYPTIISINDAYTDLSKKLLCAHELGHALLHTDTINHFRTTANNSDAERDANLFAISLVFDDDIDKKLTMPLSSMSNYLLKEIIECNLKLKH